MGAALGLRRRRGHLPRPRPSHRVRPGAARRWRKAGRGARHLLRDEPEIVTLSVLALTGGALTTVVVEEMVTEAHGGETSQLEPIFLTAGFALFGAISVYFGE